MSQSESKSVSTNDSSTDGSSGGRIFLTLRKTADWHNISPSYLSRRVRAGKAAKGHILHPYVHFEKTEDEQERVFGFSFPADYEPSDSVAKGVGRERSQKSDRRTEKSAGTDSRERSLYAQEERAPARGRSTSEESSDGRSDVEDDTADLEEDIEELESTLTHVASSLETIAKKLSKVDDRQQRIENEVASPTGEIRKSLWEMREVVENRFEKLNERRRDDSEVVHEQLRNLQDRTNKLNERLQTVVDNAIEELEWSREQDLEDLSARLQEGIRDPILEVLAQDERGESVEMNALGFGSALILVKILEERPDLLAGAISALIGNLDEETEPLSPPKSGDRGKNNSDSSGA